MRRTYWMSVEQVLTIIAALMLASCVRVNAQFGVEQPMFAMTSTTPSSPWTPTNSPDILLWWVSSDIPLGSVTNWTDRVVGKVIQQDNAPFRPENTTNGVYFDGTDILTNLQATAWYTYHVGAGGCSIGVIMKSDNWNSGVTREILDGYTGGSILLFASSSTQLRYNGSYLIRGLNGTNTWKDLIVVSDTTESKGYTNGIVGADTGSRFDSWAGAYVGNVPARSSPLNGSIAEIMVWTNRQGSTLISNFHHYATNTYKFSP